MTQKTTLILVVVLLLFSSAAPALACWMAPVPFEIFSNDGSRIFVFTPSEESSSANARAALYEICNNERLIYNERQMVYAVKDLSSFAYEDNFRFSTDMMHFARIFPPFGMDAFEVFSYGIRTRVVLRSDFIEDYASYTALLSIGPAYTVNWRIEHTSHDTTIFIQTDERTVSFDLATASFDWETVSSAYYKTPPAIAATPIAQTRNSSILIFIIVGAVVVSIATGIILSKMRKTKEK